MSSLVANIAGTDDDIFNRLSVSHGVDIVYFNVGNFLRVKLTPDEARKAAEALERGAVLAEMSGDVSAGAREEDK